MEWWNIIKQTDMEMPDAGMEMDAEEGGIKPAKDMHEAREHPVDPAIAEEMELKPALLSKVVNVAYKESLSAERQEFEDLEHILEVVKKS